MTKGLPHKRACAENKIEQNQPEMDRSPSCSLFLSGVPLASFTGKGGWIDDPGHPHPVT